MTVKADLERGWSLPADTVVFDGRQLDALRREGTFVDVIAGAKIQAEPPEWAAGRRADMWLVAEDGGLACPMRWDVDGVLTVMVVLHRDRMKVDTDAWLDALSVVPEPLADRHVQITPHARDRWNERRSNADLDAALRTARACSRQPDWANSRKADGWLLLGDDCCAPLVHGMHGAGAVVTTFLVLEEDACAS